MKNSVAVDTMIEKLGINRYQRHIFICTGDKCCSERQGKASWDYLKLRCKDLGLTNQRVYRSKANCLRVCLEGPVAVVYPEGVWYKNVDEKACEKIIQEHLIGGKPVEEFIITQNHNFKNIPS